MRKDEIEQILNIEIADLNKRLSDRKIKIVLDEKAKEYLIENGYDAVYGARPLKRFIQQKLETLIARKILEQVVVPNSEVFINCENNELTIK